jgi:hypothetical protein
MRATGSTSTRGSEVEDETILAETWLMEVERRMRFLVIENRMTRNAISASTFSGHPRCNSIPSCGVSLLRGVRLWSFLHLLSDPNWRRGKACAKDNNLYPVWSDDTIWKKPGQLCSGTIMQILLLYIIPIRFLQ